jgi:hypothetical protein
MSLDVTKEQAIPLSEVPHYVPKRRGKKVHYSTVFRWATKGVRGRVLATALSGGLRYTTIEEVHRFLSAKPSAAHDADGELSAAIEAALRKAGV